MSDADIVYRHLAYIFDLPTHQMRLNREKQRRLELATEICRALRPFARLPYEAIAAVAAVLETQEERRVR